MPKAGIIYSTKLSSTHWEARWSNWDAEEPTVEKFVNKEMEANCKLFAMQKAVELGRISNAKNGGRVDVFMVETYETSIGAYTAKDVINAMKTSYEEEVTDA